MPPLSAIQDSRLTTQLQRLDQFSHFISDIATAIVATAIVAGNNEFESVWSIANRVYDSHCSAKVRFITPPLDQSGTTALSA
jgi:hypothetical protein